MCWNHDLLERENAAHTVQVLTEIGRRLRDEYDTAQPLPACLADLVRKIAEPIQSSATARDLK
jgi:hypothetical protein